MGRQKWQGLGILGFYWSSRFKIDPEIIIPCRSKVRKWAYENAYTLIVMGVFFFVTWMYLVLDRLTR